MISGLLKKAGVYLGEEVDFLPRHEGENDEGFWEHFGFYALNERLLLHLGAGWDLPELPPGWVLRGDIAPFREDALNLIRRMGDSMNGNPAWGLKDPRNSITIEFWESLMPGLKVVVCVRNPMEVAASLGKRNNISFAAACRLWLQYYGSLLEHVPAQNRVITLYENYFANPDAEIKRLMEQLGLPVCSAPVADEVRDMVNKTLHHEKASLEQLLASDCDPRVVEMYRRLRAEAEGRPVNTQSPNPALTTTAVPRDSAPGEKGDLLLRGRFHAEVARREEHIHRLSRENEQLRQFLENFKAELTAINFMSSTALGTHPFARNLATMTERAIALHGMLSYKRSQYAALQGRVEATLKETKPMWPRFIRCSNTINSVYRMFKRLRKQGKLFTLQRELNDLTYELLGTLTHITAVTTGHRAGGSFPGLECCLTEKINMDVPNLMQLLRIRIS